MGNPRKLDCVFCLRCIYRGDRTLGGHSQHIYAGVAAFCIIAIGTVLFAQLGSVTGKTMMVVLIPGMLCAISWHSYHHLQYRSIADAVSFETSESTDFDLNLISHNVEERFASWKFGTTLISNSWTDPNIIEDVQILQEKRDDLARWEAAAAQTDFSNAALVSSFQNYEGWSYASKLLMGVESDSLDLKKQILEVANNRFLAVCRLERIRIATKLAELEHKKEVTSFDQLTQLTGFAIPDDPFANGHLLREKIGNGKWKVYSVGDDAINDGALQFSEANTVRVGHFYVAKWSGDIVLTIE